MEMPGKMETVREMKIKEYGDRNIKECTASLKVPSHQIRLGLKCYGWIGLGEYKDLKW
jgi:hypothetical protein